MKANEDLDLVASCDPLTADELDAPARRERAVRAHDLLNGILAAQRPPAQPDAAANSSPSMSRRRVLVAGAGATAAAAAAALVLANSNQTSRDKYIATPRLLNYQLAAGGTPPPPDALPPAEPVLLKLAEAAEHQGDIAEGAAGKTAYTKNRDWYLNVSVQDRKGSAEVAEEANQRFWAPDGTRRTITQRPGRALTDTRSKGPRPRWLDPGLSARQLEHLLLAGPAQGGTAGYRLMGAITRLHQDEVISSRSAAAMWHMLASQPTIRSLGRVRDRAGRTGQAVTADADFGGKWSQRRVLIIDPATGRLLASEDFYLKKPRLLMVHQNAVSEYHIYLDRRWVTDVESAP
ncbi:hypothetical protein [Actinomadura rupiterrae]|uniref:hypothetical protein n=1 Tax=Actinomadura rupiterrae TaxID=559627 RepID=UPI0020A4F207|nr:hypothetical protein [Actinomadura rupiterrae]MCP2339264.1 hypothetical protein [Actinomadura rupiterrae]